ncbi:hypothetical protein T01_10559 [Trichinella spiralis]|uniref:Uncharacterized protein n=1 Tax=Trichinella spiralis TaxID=6334 RepID=A0A0V1B5K9_TRISP|nr:hypothetical protein T01_10559 [Trichinella spiralis]
MKFLKNNLMFRQQTDTGLNLILNSERKSSVFTSTVLGCFEWAILRGQSNKRHLISFCKRAQVGKEAFNIDRYLHCKQKCLFS